MKGTACILLCLTAFCSSRSAVAQKPVTHQCDDLTQVVYILAQGADKTSPETATSIVQTARKARECYEDSASTIAAARMTWLLGYEVWGLNEQGQHDKAEALVELFYDQYFDESDDFYRGMMGMWRVRFRLLKGDIDGAKAAYDQALPYAHTLTLVQQTHLRLNGAYIYAQKDSFQAALAVAELVEKDLSHPQRQEPALREAYGRALVRTGEMIAELARNGDARTQARLDSAAVLVERAVGLFRQDEVTGRLCYGLSTLGMIHVANGDATLGLRYLNEAIETARLHGMSRQEISGLRKRGRAYAYLQEYKEAEHDFDKALRLSEETGTGELDLRLLVELAGAQESQGRMKAARLSYNRALDSAGTSILYEAKRARSIASAGVARTTRAIEQHTLRTAALLAFVLFLLGAVALRHARRRRQAAIQHPLPTPSFNVGPPLFRRRLGYIWRVLYDAEGTAQAIRDPVLEKQFRTRGVQTNTEIFSYAAALEEKETERVFEGRPANTYASYLRPLFAARGWTWPHGIQAWQRHFRAHPPERRQGVE